jgi:hypothetical protein
MSCFCESDFRNLRRSYTEFVIVKMTFEENNYGSRTSTRHRVAVVGVGALGSELCRLLLLEHCFDVLLIDPDRIEERNLRYCKMLQSLSISRFGNSSPYKTDLVLEAARPMDPLVRWDSIPREIADCNPLFIKNCDLIFCCTDSVLSRCETALIARLLGKGMVDGGVHGQAASAGRVTWFPAIASQACYACQLSEWRRAEVLAYALSPSLGCVRPTEEPVMDASPSVLTVIASRMIDLGRRAMDTGIDWQHRTESTAWVYHMQSAQNCITDGANPEGRWSKQEITLLRSATCPWHDTETREQLTVVDPSISMQEVLHQVRDRDKRKRAMAMELLWPICLRARCSRCRAECKLCRRLAWLRRYGRCASCGSVAALDPLIVVQTVLTESELAHLTFHQIGFNEPQLLCVRPEYGKNERGPVTLGSSGPA